MNNQTICFGDYVTMQANAVPAGIFYWGPNAVQGNSSNTFLPVQDTVIQVYNSLNGCNSDTITAQISVTPLPNSVLQGCVPLSVTLTAANSSNNSYTWQTSNQLTATSSQANFNFITNGVYDVSLTTTSNGCSSTTTITNMIAVDNYPIASFEPSVLTFTEPQQQLTFTNYSIGASSYVWDFGDASIDYSESPIHLFSQTDSGYVVLLTAISSLGCSDTASIRIDFDPGLVYYIPNSFTPDGDQFNQVFRPIFSSGIDPFNYKLHIYNRWEDLIFESNDLETGWDGTYEAGQACQSGAYTYEIFIKIPDTDEKRMIIGHVNLIR
jgi:gliding motility-associated-like protein